jgi:predicted dithiol-disulfide oxidoreductase (DUF899 family)
MATTAANHETLRTLNNATLQHTVVTEQEWIAARKELLGREKEFTRQRDELSRLRRELPWVKVSQSVLQNYVFDGPNGKETLADLFGGKSQLIIYHFMFGPGWEEGCPSCSMLADHMNGILTHLAQRDARFVAVSRARAHQIEAFKQRMGWNFKWVSSFENGFNRDFNVSFSQQEMAAQNMYYNYQMQNFPADEAPGVSVFYKDDAGNIFHTYSSYGRGLDILLNVYNFLDMTPKGRDEDALAFPMAWVRHHDRYPEDRYPQEVQLEEVQSADVHAASTSAAAQSTAVQSAAAQNKNKGSAGSCCSHEVA